jgi:hypothetical protein
LRIGFLVVTLEMMKKKPKKRSKCIKANSIVLTDSEGKTRIVLDAGEKDGYARIILFAKDGKSIQISSQPEGAIQIILFGKKFQSHAGISIGAKGEGSIFITNKEGKLERYWEKNQKPKPIALYYSKMDNISGIHLLERKEKGHIQKLDSLGWSFVGVTASLTKP